MPDALQFGQTIRLHVKKKGWGIDQPRGGEFDLPKTLTKDLFLLPVNSPEFLSDAQIDELLKNLPDNLAAQVKSGAKSEELEPTKLVQEYASEHGIDYAEVRAKVEQRIQQYEAQKDMRLRCLAAIYRNERGKTATLCTEDKGRAKGKEVDEKRRHIERLSKTSMSGQSGNQAGGAAIRVNGLSGSLGQADNYRYLPPIRPPDTNVGSVLYSWPTQLHNAQRFAKPTQTVSKQAELQKAKLELIKLIEEVVGDFRLAGDAYYVNYEFTKALGAYQEGLQYVEKDEVPTLWADMQILIGNANNEIAIRSEGPAIHHYRKAAFAAYQESLTIYTRHEFPQAWAGV